MHRYYCSYFDRNYLIKGLALIASLNRHAGTPFTLYAVCLDELTRTLLDRLALPNVVTVPLHAVEEGDAELLAAKRNRSDVEYYWTLTPSIMLWLLDRHPEIELITYLDADLYFYGDSKPIFDELGSDSILIHAHRFPEHMKHLEMYGKYNVGLLCFRRDANGMAALQWWRERCNEWCYGHIDNGRYGDQLYLDDWPQRFQKVRELEHIGAGVAPWNHIQYRFRTEADAEVWLDDHPVIFYHFHALDFAHPGVAIPAKHTLYPLREDIISHCVLPYVVELSRAFDTIRQILPGFTFGMFNGHVLIREQTVVAEKGYRQSLRHIGLDHPVRELSPEWDCHCSSQMDPPAPPYRGRAHVQLKARRPAITVVVPSYNYARYLGACLDSILSQNYPNLELIVMDGGSTDGTVEILKKYQRHLSHWQSAPDGGQYRALDEGLRRSTGEIMTWLNADDMFHPHAFETAAAVFAEQPEAEWIMGRPNSFDESGRQKGVLSYLPLNSRAKYLADEVFIQQEGVFWRRALWERSGGHIRTDMRLAADLELWARFFRHAPLYSVDALIAGYRDHPLQKSKDQAAYSAEAALVLAHERALFAREAAPYNPPPPLPILVPRQEAA